MEVARLQQEIQNLQTKVGQSVAFVRALQHLVRASGYSESLMALEGPGKQSCGTACYFPCRGF